MTEAQPGIACIQVAVDNQRAENLEAVGGERFSAVGVDKNKAEKSNAVSKLGAAGRRREIQGDRPVCTAQAALPAARVHIAILCQPVVAIAIRKPVLLARQ